MLKVYNERRRIRGILRKRSESRKNARTHKKELKERKEGKAKKEKRWITHPRQLLLQQIILHQLQ